MGKTGDVFKRSRLRRTVAESAHTVDPQVPVGAQSSRDQILLLAWLHKWPLEVARLLAGAKTRVYGDSVQLRISLLCQGPGLYRCLRAGSSNPELMLVLPGAAGSKSQSVEKRERERVRE